MIPVHKMSILFIVMDNSIHIDTIVHFVFQGVAGQNFYIDVILAMIFVFLQTVQTLMKCCLKLHFIISSLFAKVTV